MARETETVYVEVDRGDVIETRGTTGTREDNVAFVAHLARTLGAIVRVLDPSGNDVTGRYVA